jgi:hypothetical protein
MEKCVGDYFENTLRWIKTRPLTAFILWLIGRAAPR